METKTPGFEQRIGPNIGLSGSSNAPVSNAPEGTAVTNGVFGNSLAGQDVNVHQVMADGMYKDREHQVSGLRRIMDAPASLPITNKIDQSFEIPFQVPLNEVSQIPPNDPNTKLEPGVNCTVVPAEHQIKPLGSYVQLEKNIHHLREPLSIGDLVQFVIGSEEAMVELEKRAIEERANYDAIIRHLNDAIIRQTKRGAEDERVLEYRFKCNGKIYCLIRKATHGIVQPVGLNEFKDGYDDISTVKITSGQVGGLINEPVNQQQSTTVKDVGIRQPKDVSDFLKRPLSQSDLQDQENRQETQQETRQGDPRNAAHQQDYSQRLHQSVSGTRSSSNRENHIE